MSDSQNKKRSPIATILLILAIIGATAFWYFALYAPIDFQKYDKQGDYAILNANTNATRVNLQIDAAIGSISVGLLSATDDHALSAQWDYTYLLDTQQSTDSPVAITVTNSTQSGALTVKITVVKDPAANYFQIVDLNLAIKLAPTFALYAVESDIDAGSLAVDLDNVNVSALDLTTSVGSFNLDLDEVTFDSPQALIVDTSTGSIDATFHNLAFASDNSVDFTTSVGSIELTWDQFVPLGADVDFTLETSTGSIDIEATFAADAAKWDISADASVGSADFDYPQGEFVGEDHMRTTNFASLGYSALVIDATTSVGSFGIEIDQI